MQAVVRTICAFAIMAVLLLLSSACMKKWVQTRTGEDRVVVMSFNVMGGGTKRGQTLSQTAKLIRDAQADIVGVQEIYGSAEKLAKLLGWNLVRQWHSPVILTRYARIEPCDGGARIKLDSGQTICIFNVHLPPAPYQPYQLLQIPYGNAPFIETEPEAIESAQKARGAQIAALLKAIQALPDQDMPVFVTGDFNEPSHLDWTEKAAMSGRHPISVEYPSSKSLAHAGFADAWRTVYPDEMAKPGYTWTPLTKQSDPNDHHDRIDFVYFRGKGVTLNGVMIVGEDNESADIAVSPYPSDHRAVIATFTIPNHPDSRTTDANKRNAGDGKSPRLIRDVWERGA